MAESSLRLMDRFSFSEYISSCGEKVRQEDPGTDNSSLEAFYSLCRDVKAAFYKDWESQEEASSSLEIQKKAIIGCEKEKNFFKKRIVELALQWSAAGTPFPPWYTDLADAVYHENWGLAGLSEWFLPLWRQSSSAKIIGENIFFMDRGHMRLMPQKIDRDRLDQMIRAFLLLTPSERMDKSYYELYLLDGTRVTIYTEPMAKAGQAGLVFRRYLIPSLSFEEQAGRGTIPPGAIPLFKAMVRIGFNVVFLGAVRTAKTTFLSTWQSCEDASLEGVMVETDPEIPLHRLQPGSPVLQLIADGQELSGIAKNLLRSDADYFILAEARDGIALDTAVRLASKGTKRMKMTYHSRNPRRFPLEAAMEIVRCCGGDVRLTMQNVASSFDYLFHFVQLSDKSRKKLEGIYQMSLSDGGDIRVERICSYDHASDTWTFLNSTGPVQAEYAMSSDPVAFAEMKRILAELSERPQRPEGECRQ